MVTDEFVPGFALSGEEVSNMDDKKFELINAEIVKRKDFDNPERKKKKVLLTVKFSSGAEVEYYPNKRSQGMIISKRGRKLSNWVGYRGVFETKKMLVGNTERDVIFIKEGK